MDTRYAKDQAIKLSSPRRQMVAHWEAETRIELPFPDTYEQFLYISKFWYDSWFTPTQYHDHFEMCYIGAGSGWFILEGMLLHVGQGDIFVTKPGEIHCGGSTEGEPFLVFAVGFRFERMEQLEKAFYKLDIRRIVRDDEMRLLPLFERLLGEIERGQAYADSMVRSCMLAILTETIRLYEAQQEREQPADNKLSVYLLDVLALIHAEDAAIVTAGELAEAANMSRVHLDREFKRQMGVTIGEYIRGVRLERAKRLLRQAEDIPIARVAERLQFESPQAFCRFFKRLSGLSPQQFRKRLVRGGRQGGTGSGDDEKG